MHRIFSSSQRGLDGFELLFDDFRVALSLASCIGLRLRLMPIQLALDQQKGQHRNHVITA